MQMLWSFVLGVAAAQGPAEAVGQRPRVALIAKPRTERTESLADLLRSRFTVVARTEYPIDVFVVDELEPGPAAAWLPYAGPQPRQLSRPHVFVGRAVPIAIERYGFVGRVGAEPVLGSSTTHDHPIAPDPRIDGDGALAGGGHFPLAFALSASPDVEIAWSARDTLDRPIAVVWQQGSNVFFAPRAPVADLGAASLPLLDAVDFAASYQPFEVDHLPAGAPGEGALEELAWWIASGAPDLERCRALLAASHADAASSIDVLGRWFERHESALVPDAEGRLAIDHDLMAIGIAPSDGGFIERVMKQLSAETLEARERARRLLARHVADGPGYDASGAQWHEWFYKRDFALVFCPADARWRVDSRATRVEPASSRRRISMLGTASLDVADVPANLGGDALVEWLFQQRIGGKTPRVAPPLAARLAAPLAAYARRGAELQNVFWWMGRLGSEVGEIVPDLVELVERFPEHVSAVIPLVAAARPSDPQLVLDLLPAYDRHPGIATGWTRDRGFAFRALAGSVVPQALSTSIANAVDPARAAAFVVEYGLGEIDAGRFHVASVVVDGAKRSGALEPVDVRRILERVERQGGVVLTSDVLARLVARDTDPRWFPLVAAAAKSSNLGSVREESILSTLLSYGHEGRSLFLDLLDEATDERRRSMVRALASSKRFDRAWIDEWAGDEARSDLAREITAFLSSRESRGLEAERSTALGDDPGAAVLAIVKLGDAIDGQRAVAAATEALGAALTHGSPWVRRSAVFELCSRYRDVRPVSGALVDALDDEDAWVRLLAAWALREPAGVADPVVIAALEQRASGGGAEARVARDALARRAPPLGWRILALRDVRSPRTVERPLGELDSTRAERRWEAARSLALAPDALDWIARANGQRDDARVAAERVRRIEHELADWLDRLLRRMDEEFGVAWARNELGALGVLAVPALEQDLMRPYRFPIGANATYEELVDATSAIGADAWPVLAASCWHWRAHGLSDAARAWAFVAPGAADVLAPFLAMRLVRSALDGDDDFADTVAPGVLDRVWRPMWRALGDRGDEALADLAQHPHAAVRAASSRMQ